MGTSVSQQSPRIPNWNRVFACYKYENIPEDRIINELWRASEHQEISISDFLKSDAAYGCYQAIQSSKDVFEAQIKFQSVLSYSGKNSIITELGKRVIHKSYLSNNPAKEWRSLFFSEVTNYLVSRDASGFVGKNFRNKTVSDMIEFKKRISNTAKSIALKYRKEPKSLNDWKNYIQSTVDKLKE